MAEKVQVLCVSQGDFTPDGQSESIHYCNAWLLEEEDLAANPLNRKGRMPIKVNLEDSSYIKFKKAGEYTVEYKRKGKNLTLSIV